MKQIRKSKGNVLILIIPTILALFGTLMVYSASYYVAEVQYSDKFYFFKKQLIGVVIGIIAMLIFARINYEKLKKFAVPFYVLSIILLALVFVPGIGKTSYGATRWIGIGGVTIQPSELAKYSYVLLMACYIGKNSGKIGTIKGVIPIIMSNIVLCILVIIEPNLSITLCLVALMLGILILSGTKIRYIIAIIVPAVLMVPILIAIEPYRLLRLSAYLNPWQSPKDEGYQLIQSLYALGNGGFFGVGLFNSRQKYKFLPFAESDFILSIIGEEFGFLGCTVLFLLIFFLVYLGFKTAFSSRSKYGFILSCGITLVFVIQSIVNALVVTGTIPPTGLPLPLISSGNTSLIITLAMMGVLYNVSANH